MRRLHLFEFGDQHWFPQILRDAETAYLTAAYRVWPALARQWAEKISTVLHPNAAVEIIDLCAGSGGAMPQIIEDLRQRNYDVRAILTDLYPNPNSGLDSWITWLLDPVDALHVPQNGVRYPLFNAQWNGSGLRLPELVIPRLGDYTGQWNALEGCNCVSGTLSGPTRVSD